MGKKALGIFLGMVALAWSATTATRDLPAFYAPGSSFVVTVSVAPDPEITGVILSETLPAGWTMTGWAIVPEILTISSNPEPDTYKWVVVLGTESMPFAISYTVQVPADTSGVQSFSGTVSVSGGRVYEVGGDRVIEEKGDLDADGSITVADVVLCARMAAGDLPPDLEKGDLDSDGSVTDSDAVMLLRDVMGLP